MENKTWIIVVLIILVALVAYNFTNMTGEVTKDQITKITVSPTSVGFDKYETMKLLTINVKVGTIGIDRQLELFKITTTGSARVGTESIDVCTDDICEKNTILSYKLDSELEKGTYFLRGERDNYDSEGHNIVFDSNKFTIE